MTILEITFFNLDFSKMKTSEQIFWFLVFVLLCLLYRPVSSFLYPGTATLNYKVVVANRKQKTIKIEDAQVDINHERAYFTNRFGAAHITFSGSEVTVGVSAKDYEPFEKTFPLAKNKRKTIEIFLDQKK